MPGDPFVSALKTELNSVRDLIIEDNLIVCGSVILLTLLNKSMSFEWTWSRITTTVKNNLLSPDSHQSNISPASQIFFVDVFDAYHQSRVFKDELSWRVSPTCRQRLSWAVWIIFLFLTKRDGWHVWPTMISRTGRADVSSESKHLLGSAYHLLSWMYMLSNLRQSYTNESGPGGIQTHNLLMFGQTPKPCCLGERQEDS